VSSFNLSLFSQVPVTPSKFGELVKIDLGILELDELAYQSVILNKFFLRNQKTEDYYGYILGLFLPERFGRTHRN